MGPGFFPFVETTSLQNQPTTQGTEENRILAVKKIHETSSR